MSKIFDIVILSVIIDVEREVIKLYKVKEVRESRGMTQDELAKKSGVSRATIASIESVNSDAVTTTKTLLQIAAALECKISDIFL